MQDKLKPCPFCGGSGAHYCNNDKRAVHYVACTRCGIEGIGGINDDYATKQWNTRIGDYVYLTDKKYYVAVIEPKNITAALKYAN